MTHGPGTTALATLTGIDADEIATKPIVALRAVTTFAKDMAHLAVDRASDDPVVRAAAERRTAEIAALVRGVDEEHPSAAGERFRRRLEEALTKVLHDLEAAGDKPSGDRADPA